MVRSVKKNKILFWIILILGSLVRLLYIGNIPGNTALFNDEAVSAYDAFSLLHYGTDMNGYHMPVYLISMGDGTSIMQPIILMPFIALLGLNSFSVRLPQAILGCITLPAIYYLAKKLRNDNENNEEFALLAMGIFAIIPWHIMMTRWALDCNIVVPFIIIATALMIKSTENQRYLILTAIVFVFSMYSYAVPWLVLPFIVVGSLGYLLYKHMIKIDINVVLFCIIIGVFAIPLFLFILVNAGIIPEIRTSFLSVPLVPDYRSGELSLNPKQMLLNLNNAIEMFVSQDDGRVSNVTPMYGLFYKFSGIPILIGIGASVYDIFVKKVHTCFNVLILIQLVSGFVLCLILTDMVFNRVNIILFPLTIYLIVGLQEIILFFKDLGKISVYTIYFGAFIAFLCYYISVHDNVIAENYGDGMRYGIEFIQSEEVDSYPVTVLSGMNYAQILYYTAYPTDEYLATREYDFSDKNKPSWPNVLHFGRFSFSYYDHKLTDYKSLYMSASDDADSIDFMKENGMDIHYFNAIAVGVYEP